MANTIRIEDGPTWKRAFPQANVPLLVDIIGVDQSRDEVAEHLRRQLGAWVYVGGHHVAVHERASGPRLAIVTGTSPDWV